MQIKLIKLAAIISVSAIITSCGSKKDIVYFYDSEGTSQKIENFLTPKLESGDIISVEISCSDPEIAKPFNKFIPVNQGNQIITYDNGAPASRGYLIDADSTVSLPILGKIKVGGLYRTDAVKLIEKEVSKYMETPSVSIRILNFKVTLLGDVKKPGTYTIPNERVTLLEALGVANDLEITGNRTNVLVIRHENGERNEYRVDLTGTELFESPVYYLKQNDVVYVQPNKKARYEASLLRTAGGIIISGTSLIISTLVLIFR